MGSKNYSRSYRGIGFELKWNCFWRVHSEIGDFYGQEIRAVMDEFRAAVNEGLNEF